MKPRSPIADALLVFVLGLLGLLGSLAACGSGGSPPASPGQAGATGSAGAAAGASGSSGSAGVTGAGGLGAAGASGAGGGVAGTSGSAGAAGSTSTAGVSGSAGAAGTAGGAGGATGVAGAGGKPTGMSAGCGKPVNEPAGMWTTHDTTVTVDPQFAAQSKRRYFTNPPKTYDPSMAWPVTFWGNGCGTGSTAEGELLMGGPASTSSVQVQLLAFKGCFSAGPDGDNANSPELPYFDQVLSEVEAEYCIDRGKVFVAGYSSGAWFTGLMSCNRANVISGVGLAAGGLQVNHPPCAGQTAGIVVRGTGDGGTPEARTLDAVNSLVMRNGCTMNTVPWDPGEKAFNSGPCLAYQGCQPGFPVVYCPVPGGHTDGGTLTSQGFWKFWTSP
jgi:polyhydroxybutyrate depolymerase